MKSVLVSADWAPRDGYGLSDFEADNRRAVNGNQVWQNPKWEITDRTQPDITAPDQVLVKIKACGVCGSDVHMYETDDAGYILLAYRTKFPCVLGHEFAGEVAAVGDAVTRFRAGDAVAVEEINYCGDCRACRFGLFNQCPNAEDIGFTVDGAFAEYVVVRERYCWSLNPLREIYSDDKVYEIGSLVEPTSVAYQGVNVRTHGFRPGAHVVVFGCGPIGLAAIQLARAGGACRVIAIDTSAPRREVALRTGADAALDPVAVAAAGSAIAKEVMHLTNGEGAAHVIEATGYGQATFPEIDNMLDFGAKVAIIGVDPLATPIHTPKYLLKAASLYGSLGHCGGDFGYVINLHLAKRIDMTEIVTARFDLADGVDAVIKTAERTDAKVLVKP